MNFGSGSLGFVSASSSGGPFPAGSANNGLSVDPATGLIVLGNDESGLSGLAKLLSNREISMEGFLLRLLQIGGGETAGALVVSSGTIVNNNFQSKVMIEGSLITKRNAAPFTNGAVVDGQKDNFAIFVGMIPNR